MARNTVKAGTLLLSAAGIALTASPVGAQTAPPLVPAPPPLPVKAPPPPSPAPVKPAATTTERPITTFANTLTPYVGNIRTFTGDIDPSVGNIRTFNGDLNPYVGNIRTFSGDVNPYVGNIRTFWGDLAPSAGSLDPLIGNIRTFSDIYNVASKDALGTWLGLGSSASTADYAAVLTKLNTVVAQSKTSWGAQVAAKTGQSFEAAFLDPMLQKHGIDLADANSLAKLDPYSRQMFFLDWYDQLMQFSGMDQVDWWVGKVNWSPSITKTIGEGKRSVIGLLDFTVTGSGTENITKYDGISTFSNGHGAAVASLMIAKHDGQGVMGIAPMASVVSYNPFDSSGTANWDDVKNGVLMLAQNNASIINMSLGEPGYTLPQGWNGVFGDAAVASFAKQAIFVIAAGNDGVVQKTNITWDKSNPYMIVVGSIAPDDHISAFSNQPGTACLVKAEGRCDPGMKLMDRFITAPGEMILVSDGQGGVTRVSGTSFAAPLVSGTIALLHDRWPWLSNHPKESVDIILQSARDAGAPGTDAVYGRGILDVTAALSPLSFDGLKWYQYDAKGNIVETQTNKIRDPKEQAKWEAAGRFFYAYEDVGATFRDFAIPVSSKLVDGTAMSMTGSSEYLQSYIYSRFMVWAQAGGKGAPPPRKLTAFTSSASVPNASGLALSMAVAPRTSRPGFRQGQSPYQMAMQLNAPGSRFSFMFGDGDGAVMLGNNPFGLASDFDPATGGANPILGYASGNAYVQTTAKLGKRLRLSAGLTRRELRRDLRDSDFTTHAAFGSINPYRAGAQHLSLTYDLPMGSITATYTHLHEASAMLGIQSTNSSDFADGSSTDGFTAAADLNLTPTLVLAAAGTASRTRAGKDSQFAPSGPGLVSTSFQVSVTKRGLVGRTDMARVSFAQPLHLEQASIDMTTVQVVDRQTGQLGPVTERFNLSTPQRQFVSEVIYGRTMMDGAAQLSLFGRATLNGDETTQLPRMTAGTSFRMQF
jgi:hypothetical protein